MQRALSSRLTSEDGTLKVISKRRAVAVVGTTIIVIIIVAVCVYVFLRPQTNNLSDVSVVTSLVSKQMVLPKDETPALVTVTDPSKLTTEFLKGTEVGDKVLIYQTNEKAIIYRPSLDRIIDVGPVVIDDVTGESN